MNRRNAFVGWLAWEIGKRVLKRRAAAAVPSFDTDTKRPNRSALIVAGALVAGLAWLWFRGGGDGDLPTE